MIVLIDNYDSFTYNIAEYLEKAGAQVRVFRNDKITVEEIKAMNPQGLVLSPGPGTPDEAGICLDAVRRLFNLMPILGICLGHQVIVQAFGGSITAAPSIVHGKIDDIDHDGKGLFRNITSMIRAARYHSLAADPASIPAELDITAWSRQENTIMGVRHRDFPIEGVQFHPESVGTPMGKKLIDNFLTYRRQASPVLTIIRKCASGEDLNKHEASDIMDEITEGELTDGQLGAFLGSMSVKGITAVELSSFASVLRSKTGVSSAPSGLLDTCGTGGDSKGTFNYSTAAALCCAAYGIPVAKHGNKAISSRSGSYDFLKELGIPTDSGHQKALKHLENHHFAFLFAPRFHSAMRFVAQVRQELHMRTLFNLIGPLVNPFSPDFQVAGVYDPGILDIYAEALLLLGVKRGLVVHSADGMDELSISALTYIREISEGRVTSYTFDPSDIIKTSPPEEERGKNAHENADIFLQVITGNHRDRSCQAVREGICLNSGAALYAAGRAESIADGYRKAASLIDDGTAAKYVERLKEQNRGT